MARWDARFETQGKLKRARTTRRWAKTPLLAALVAVFVFVDRCGFDEVVFHQAILEFFTRYARGLERSRILEHRRRTRHDLARAARREHHISKLALRSFCQHSHLSLSLQTMPEVLRLARGVARWSNAARSKSIAPRAQHVRRRHSSRNSRNISRIPQSRSEPLRSGA